MTRLEELKALGLAWNEAWNSRDPARLSRFFAPGGTFFEPTMPGPASGAEAVAANAARTWSEWPGAVFDLLSITVEGDRVVVEWRTSATHRSGLEHLLEGVDILEFEGDRVVACRSYYDTRTRKNRGRHSSR